MHAHRSKLKGLVKMGRIKRLGMFLFVSSIAFSIVSSIWAVYLNSFLNNESLVGFVSSFLVFVSFISYFLIVPLVERSNKLKLSIGSTFLIMIGYFFYSLLEHFSLVMLVALLLTFAVSLKLSCSGILIERNSKKKDLSKNEGLVYTFINFAYVLGPLIAGFLLAKYGLRIVFLVAVGFLLLSLIFLKLGRLNSGGIKKKTDNSPIKTFVDFFKDKNRFKIYILSSGVNFWWSLVFIYVPLLIIKELPAQWMGYFFFATAVPLVLLEYLFGEAAGRVGYKKFFFLGYLGAGLLAVISFFVLNIFYVMALLVFASVFLSMLESLTESYFFDICKGKQDQRFYAPYNTAIDFGGFIGEIFGAIFIWFFSFKVVFLVYGIGMIVLSLYSLSTKEVIERKRKS